MGSNISVFPSYVTAENRLTNHCLLVLKLIYEQNPKLLAEVLGSLLGDNGSDLIGVKFKQQIKRKGSVPDGLLLQRPFAIYIETKTFDWFYDDQLERHLDALMNEQQGTKILIALGAFENLDASRFENIRALCKSRYDNAVSFEAVSFETFIEVLESLAPLPPNLNDVLSDFREYLDQQGLLPRWQQTLDVVNCAGLPEEVLEGNVYLCPAEGGAYSHARAKYFGMYKNKAVERVALIEAVVDILSEEDQQLKWKNIDADDEFLIQRAREKHREWRPGEYPIRVFVLGPLSETRFVKASKGGMLGSKRYFDVSTLEPKDVRDLAAKMSGLMWPEGHWQVSPQ